MKNLWDELRSALADRLIYLALSLYPDSASEKVRLAAFLGGAIRKA